MVGVKTIGFFDLRDGGRHLAYEKALISSKGRIQGFQCCCWMNDTAIAGTSDGQLYIFEPQDGKLSREMSITRKAHDDMVSPPPLLPFSFPRALPPLSLSVLIASSLSIRLLPWLTF